MSLCVLRTNASQSPDTILRKGQSVPFDGVLMNEMSYREMVSDNTMLDFTKKVLNNCEVDKFEMEQRVQPRTVLDYAIVFGLGLIAGGLYVGSR